MKDWPAVRSKAHAESTRLEVRTRRRIHESGTATGDDVCWIIIRLHRKHTLSMLYPRIRKLLEPMPMGWS